jgi:hypothetical protein
LLSLKTTNYLIKIISFLLKYHKNLNDKKKCTYCVSKKINLLLSADRLDYVIVI